MYSLPRDNLNESHTTAFYGLLLQFLYWLQILLKGSSCLRKCNENFSQLQIAKCFGVSCAFLMLYVH